MRTSKRSRILDAAVAVVEREGITALTFESIAAECGLTKGGLLYHFATKDQLMLALHQHLAQQWEEDLTAALGMPCVEATPGQRLAAYARVSVRSATRPELLLMLESVVDQALQQPWRDVLSRWVPNPETIDPNDPQAVAGILAYLAADGLWLNNAIGGPHLTPELRVAVAAMIADPR